MRGIQSVPNILIGLLISTSGMRYAKELDSIRNNSSEIGELKLIEGVILNSLEKYGIHPLNTINGLGFKKVKSIIRLPSSFEAYSIEIENDIRFNLSCLCSVSKTPIYGVVAPDQSIYAGSEFLGVEINTPAVYSASKGAVLSLTKYLATFWAKHNIRVNTLTPGGVESGQNNTFVNNYSRKVPLGRMGKFDELLGALLFLASDASTYVTGQNIIMDGGFTGW